MLPLQGVNAAVSCCRMSTILPGTEKIKESIYESLLSLMLCSYLVSLPLLCPHSQAASDPPWSCAVSKKQKWLVKITGSLITNRLQGLSSSSSPHQLHCCWQIPENLACQEAMDSFGSAKAFLSRILSPIFHCSLRPARLLRGKLTQQHVERALEPWKLLEWHMR